MKAYKKLRKKILIEAKRSKVTRQKFNENQKFLKFFEIFQEFLDFSNSTD